MTEMAVCNVDVLIIGAGPAGYMLGNALTHLGIHNVLLIDKRQKGLEAGQADGIQPRTIEILQSYGLARRLLDEANWMCMASMYNPDPVTGGIKCSERLPDVNAPTARWPHELTLHQGGIEAIFRDAMKEKGLHVTFATTVTSMAVDEDAAKDYTGDKYPVEAVLAHEDTSGKIERSTVRAKFVVGCDGAHSWTRKWMGHEMQGEQTDYIWGVMDGQPDTDFPDWRAKSAVHSNHGSCMVLPRENNTLRVYIQMASQSVEQGGRVDRAAYKLQDIQDAAAKILKPYTIHFPRVDWWTIYVIGQRVASGYRSKDGRVLIAGDACHTHSPKAGQGGNAAMGDTHNLAWKLSLVLRGMSKDPNALLDTYQTERRSFAQDLIAFDKVFAKLFSGKAQSNDVPEGVTHEQFVEAFRQFGAFSSGIGIDYMPPQDGSVRAAKLSSKEAQDLSDNSLLMQPSSEAQRRATDIKVGMRMPTTTVVRSADGRPFELHDLMPTTGAFHVFLWVGDISMPQQKSLAEKVGDDVDELLRRYTAQGQRWDSIIDVITIASTSLQTQFGWSLPSSLRLRGAKDGWTKIFTDDLAFFGATAAPVGGKAHELFGIDKQAGGVAVVVRPDGYVGCVATLEDFASVQTYFAQNLRIASAL